MPPHLCFKSIQDLIFCKSAFGFLAVIIDIERLRIIARLKLASTGNSLVPSEKVTYLNIFEMIAEALYKLAESIIGAKGAKKYFPLVGTLFVYILISNLVGLIQGPRRPAIPSPSQPLLQESAARGRGRGGSCAGSLRCPLYTAE